MTRRYAFSRPGMHAIAAAVFLGGIALMWFGWTLWEEK